MFVRFVRMTRGSMPLLKEVYFDKIVWVLDIPLIRLIVAILLKKKNLCSFGNVFDRIVGYDDSC